MDGTNRIKPTIAYLDMDTYTKTVNGQKITDTPKWVFKNREATKKQKKKLIALALMAVSKSMLEN